MTEVLRTQRVERASVQYPGGLSARYRWAGSAAGEAVFAESETGGELHDFAALGSRDADRTCRAELRVEGPLGAWTARFASRIHDVPEGLLWDTESLLVVKYGFGAYALAARTGLLRWSFASGTPILALLGSSRLKHVLVQTEVETIALDASGEVVWRAAHSDVVTEAELIGGRLVLTSFGGAVQALDPETGRPAV